MEYHVCKRENNSKRNFVVVNDHLAKHVPVEPDDAMYAFTDLASTIYQHYCVTEGTYLERILIIGFAETATALALNVAVNLNLPIICTTRESKDFVKYLEFSEEHSHATQQLINKTELDTIIDRIDHVIFVDDEITTGNTIVNATKVINEAYPDKKLKYTMASLLNGMSKELIDSMESSGIDVVALDFIDYSDFDKQVENVVSDGDYYICDDIPFQLTDVPVNRHTIYMSTTQRSLVKDSDAYDLEVCNVCHSIADITLTRHDRKILVLGTEEFMDIPLAFASSISNVDVEVKCHSTTRSPIDVSKAADYPLNVRYEMKSVYDENRTAYIYNLEAYDRVVIITDANLVSKGMSNLCNALAHAGSRNIDIVRICSNED